MITDDEIDTAVHWLASHAEEAARARAERVYCEEYRKSLKAILASQSNEKAEAAKERSAYAHPKYLEHLEALKKAVLEDEKNRALRGAAEMKIEAWRSQEANKRSIKL